MNITRIPSDTETDYLKCLQKKKKKQDFSSSYRSLLLTIDCLDQID